MLCAMDSTRIRIAKRTGNPDRRCVEVPRPTISLRIDPAVLRRIDAYVVATGVNRSRIIERALVSFLESDSMKFASK